MGYLWSVLLLVSALLSNDRMAMAAPVATCLEQAPCITFESTALTTNECAEDTCVEAYEVCVTLDTASPGCEKNGGGLSHICPSGVNGTCLDDTPSWQKLGNVAVYTQCQVLGPNEAFYFIAKDGNAANAGGCGEYSDGNVQCNKLNGSEALIEADLIDSPDGCSNGANGQQNRECVWSYTTPADCTPKDDCPLPNQEPDGMGNCKCVEGFINFPQCDVPDPNFNPDCVDPDVCDCECPNTVRRRLYGQVMPLPDCDTENCLACNGCSPV